MKEMVDQITNFMQTEARTETVIGDTFQLGEFSCIPVIRVGMGFGTGAGEGDAPKQGHGTGGGAGAGMGSGSGSGPAAGSAFGFLNSGSAPAPEPPRHTFLTDHAGVLESTQQKRKSQSDPFGSLLGDLKL